MRRIVAILSAWAVGWMVYMVAMIVTVYDGVLSMLFQPIIGGVVASLAVLAGTMQSSGERRPLACWIGRPAQSTRHSICSPTKRCGPGWWNEVVAGPATTARGPRALPFQLHRSGLGSLVVGLVFRIPAIGRAWRAVWFVAPALAVASIVLMCFGSRWGLTTTFTEPETGVKTTGLLPEVGITSYLVLVFVIANWPLKPKPNPQPPSDSVSQT